MNLEEAKKLSVGQIVYHIANRNADGTAMRGKVTSIKLWVRKPERIVIKLKHGLYDHVKFNETELYLLTLNDITTLTKKADKLKNGLSIST
jgi:hypothetical protein